MLDLFRAIRNLLKISHTHIDLATFRLHYQITCGFLIAFSLLVTISQFLGDPIDCITSGDLSHTTINKYCWIHSTYTIKSAFTNRRIGVEVAHPGIEMSQVDEEKRYVKYYQWVWICLFFQAICFYAPRWMWKNWEGGKIHALMMDLDVGICSEVERKQKKKLLLDYLADNLKHHDWWAYRYFFCELLTFLNVIGQMFLIDRFLGGTFWSFGLEVIKFMGDDQEERMDPMIFVFPRMTKCSFSKFGTSGELQRYDSLCILPLNILNEKIYIFLWFWFLLLVFLTFFVLLYRLIIILSPRIRAYLLCLRFRLINKEVITTIVCQSKMGDWFLFYMLGQNVDTLVFKEMMHELAKRLGHASEDFGGDALIA